MVAASVMSSAESLAEVGIAVRAKELLPRGSPTPFRREARAERCGAARVCLFDKQA